jgi:hypothetical protein
MQSAKLFDFGISSKMVLPTLVVKGAEQSGNLPLKPFCAGEM